MRTIFSLAPTHLAETFHLEAKTQIFCCYTAVCSEASFVRETLDISCYVLESTLKNETPVRSDVPGDTDCDHSQSAEYKECRAG